MPFDINETPVLEAHDENPFLMRRKFLHGKIVYICGVIGLLIIAGYIGYVLFIHGTPAFHSVLTEAPLPTGTPPKNSVLLDKSTSQSGHMASKSAW